MEDVTLPAVIATLLGVIAPIIVSFIKQVSWSPFRVQLVVVVVSIGAAIIALVVSGTFQSSSITIESLSGYAAYIAVVAQFVYQTYFRETALNARLENIGNAAGGIAPPPDGG